MHGIHRIEALCQGVREAQRRSGILAPGALRALLAARASALRAAPARLAGALQSPFGAACLLEAIAIEASAGRPEAGWDLLEDLPLLEVMKQIDGLIEGETRRTPRAADALENALLKYELRLRELKLRCSRKKAAEEAASRKLAAVDEIARALLKAGVRPNNLAEAMDRYGKRPEVSGDLEAKIRALNLTSRQVGTWLKRNEDNGKDYGRRRRKSQKSSP